jgi:hypothetical protein
MATNPTNPSPPTNAGTEPSMNWVMVLWIFSFLLVVIFGVTTYLLGWWFQRG